MSPLRQRIYFEQGGTCTCGCDQPLIEGWQIDHIHPQSLGGPNDRGNLRGINLKCHQPKSANELRIYWKIKKLRGELKQRVKRLWPKRKLNKGQRFQKRREPQ